MLRLDSSRLLDVLWSKHEALFADKVMKEDDWARLRKPGLRHRLQPYKLGKVMLGYFRLLVYVATLSTAVGLYSTFLAEVHGWPMLSVDSVQTFFAAITFALTLLLVFKTNSSYARWWEARKDVGQLVSFVHNIVRQGVAYFPPEQAQLTQALARWAAASMYVVKGMVRPSTDTLREELEGLLMPEELAWLIVQPHKPLALGQALSTIVAAAAVDPLVKLRMDAMVTLYTFSFGACGRIYNTAIPSAYSRHTSRFLLCYIFIGLPLLLWPLAHWASPILAVVISFLLLGVENIGAHVEEPFHVIAFDAFCRAVQRDVSTIMSMHNSTGDIPGGPDCNAPVVVGLNHTIPGNPAAAFGPAATPPIHHGNRMSSELRFQHGMLDKDATTQADAAAGMLYVTAGAAAELRARHASLDVECGRPE